MRVISLLCFSALILPAQTRDIPLASPDAVKTVNVKAAASIFKSRRALRVADASPASEDEYRLAILPGTDFRNGTIEIELAGDVAPGSMEGARGFTGVAFRLSADARRFECFYLRPSNGRAEDQVRRNHSAQYVSVPDFPWFRLRKEFPEMYESYVDLVPGAWTKVRIEVEGAKARLYVHGAGQPVLIVNDLKMGAAAAGPIALWVGPGTVAHFANLRVMPR